ncbi:ABC transporter ATP-binding protein/permease [Thomasclavelia saccharogumia]|uniref:ABC transporter ATP-binding protein/permease n=1 Tax=Thomasclavelia saccharogumia TaxID=341225 RepID=UPI00047BCF82|nr:ABC transporter ATP-binding protein/permease [Thomasclavelia saccharogumia]
MLQVKNIYKEYKTGNLVQKALDDVSLNLRDNEFVAILGPSGSGKTTLLNIIGGLDRYDSGDMIINGISTKKYKDRDWDSYRNHTIGFVFQSYNLISHQTVLANVELALTISGISKAERKERAKKALEQVGLGNQGHKKPNQMSGGQMQRVAIARALINNPDILLADEPTGALDSETSVQVMELLKEVAKDRLVVMVTHNPELAKEYATRIVELRDGVIRSDSNEYIVKENELETPRHENMGKSSMSFLTALSLSFNNLKIKKARTILTSFAGSIGIIGISLILSLSNGVNQYIKTIEEETLSEYPLQIQSSGIDLTSMLVEDSQDSNETDDETKIQVAQMITNMFSRIGSNDLESLKTYLDENNSDIGKYTNSIEYSYSAVPQIYSSNTEKIRQVNPDESFSALGLGSSASSNSMMSMMSTDVFYQMPSNSKLYEDQYDIKAGRWPKNYKECVLVLTKSGKISDLMLYTLGLRDYSELDEMVQQFARDEEVTTPDNIESYDYDDVLETKFKLVNSSDYYVYDETYNIYRDKTNDEAYMKELINNSEDLTIVGVVQPADGASATMLNSGIGYLSSLTSHVMEQASSSEIVRKQLADPSINVFTGQSFENEANEQNFDMQSLFTVDTEMLKNAFSIDQNKLKIDQSSLDLSNISLDFNSLPAINTNDFMSDINIELSNEQFTSLMQALAADFQDYMTKNNLTDPEAMNEYFRVYLQTSQAQDLIQRELTNILQESGVITQFQNKLQTQIQTAVMQYGETMIDSLQKQLSAEINRQMGQLATNMQDAISIDTNAFASAIKVNMNEEDLSELMISLMSKETTSYDNNLSKLQYAEFNKPSSINIYPKDFESKQEVINILDSYNDRMEKIDDNKVITYTDYVGALMSSVTDIINMISYVLVAFVAISLVVSSIMIGVITYISVLERKKEIGILRAIGASKHNISQVFNAETFIIGLLAGLLGIGITLLLLIPGNMVIHHIAGNNSLNAALPIEGAIILIILSVVLTLIGGLIPSKKAAQEDAVTALRSE